MIFFWFASKNLSKTLDFSQKFSEENIQGYIQDQCEILSLAVQDIMAVSSEEIYSSRRVSTDSKENIDGNTRQTLIPLEDDVDFKEALNKFSEETLSMSAENILSAPVKNISKSQRRKYLNRSFNTFPIIDEGRSSEFYFNILF